MAETRQQEYVGSIKKCPSCGQVLQSFQARCPACGFELSGIGVVNSVKEFFDSYQRETDKARQLDLIKLYPVPNSKEDILEFALLATQQIKSFANSQASRTNMQSMMSGGLTENGGILGAYKSVLVGNKGATKIKDEDFYIAWKDKLEQVHLKAELAFGDDKRGFEQLSKIIDDAIEAVNNLENKKKGAKKKYIIFIAVIVVFLLAFYVIFIPLFLHQEKKDSQQRESVANTEEIRLENLMTEIQSDISIGDYDSAELKLTDLKWKFNESTHKTEVETWDAKREILQKQIDSKREGK